MKEKEGLTAEAVVFWPGSLPLLWISYLLLNNSLTATFSEVAISYVYLFWHFVFSLVLSWAPDVSFARVFIAPCCM